MIKSIYENRYFGVLLIFILSLPVIFINRQISTDWGGDFAMYINEALNIAHFKQVTATHYVYNENAPMLGPEFYPVGFPLLLAPVCLLFGNNIPVLIIYMSLILVITATVLFLFFREYFSMPVAVILTLVIVYNPWTLIFKNEILADIPFTLFFVLTQLLYLRKAPAWITGTVMGFTVLIKTAGFVLPAGFVLYYLYNLIKRKNRYKELVFPVFYALILVLTVNVLIFKIPSGPGLYSGNFNFTAFKHNFLLNVSLYIEIFQSFFYRILDDWKFLMLITQSAMLTFLLIGIINAKKNLICFVFVTYLLLLFVYPYHSSGFRFLLPVIPVMLVFSTFGFKNINWKYKVDKKLIIFFAAVFLLGQYFPETKKLIDRDVKILSGPQEKSSQEAFDFIKKNTENDAVILFLKPRVLALFTGRNSVCNELSDSNEKIDELIKKKSTGYILTNKDLNNKAIDRYIKQNGNKLQLIWQNEKFKFYKTVYQ